MKFDEVIVNRKNYNIALITWTYLHNLDLSYNNFFIRISLAGTKTGPFRVIAEIPSTDVYFEYANIFKKWQYYYYKLEIVSEDAIIKDSRIVELSEHTDPYVRKIRKKYDLYLSNRVKNPAVIYKKKKNGTKCKYCWDSAKDEFVKSQCSVCFGTGYGDDNIFGVLDLKPDGWLKKNNLENLEFYRRDWTFEEYPAINSNVDFGIFKGDEFRIENNGTPVFSTQIIGTKKNSIHLEYNSNFVNYLEDNTFSVYGLEKKSEFEIITRLINEPDMSNGVKYRLYHKGMDFSSIDFDAISFGDPEVTNFPARYINNYIQLDDNETEIQEWGGWPVYYLKKGDTIVSTIETSSMLVYSNCSFESNERCILYLKDNNILTSDRIYIDYYYDGIYETIINGKTYIISNTKEPKKSLAYFSVLTSSPVTFNNAVYLKLETLSEYVSTNRDLYDWNSVESQKINFMMSAFGKSNMNAFVYRASDRYAMYRHNDKFLPNTKYKLEHKNIKKDAFDGCGVLLIDLVKGITYRGPTWDGIQYLNDGDFYVDPEIAEIDTLNLEEGIYELTYIYKVKDLEFNSYFIPTNFKIINNKLETNNWIFKHSSLKNKENLVGKFLTISEKSVYEEFEIISYNKEYGVIICKNEELDADDFYNSLTEASVFNVVYPHTGGFYTGISSWINYINSLSKIESLREEGISSDVIFNSITYFYPRIEPDDLIFDVKTRLFYNIEQVDTPYFRRAELYQKMAIKEAPTADQDRLYKLLDR